MTTGRRDQDKTLKEFIEECLKSYGEKWEDVIYFNFPHELLNALVGDIEREFHRLNYSILDDYLWTHNNVYYFSAMHDTNLVIDRVPRNPPEEKVEEERQMTEEKIYMEKVRLEGEIRRLKVFLDEARKLVEAEDYYEAEDYVRSALFMVTRILESMKEDKGETKSNDR